jgi:hypothetical protein
MSEHRQTPYGQGLIEMKNGIENEATEPQTDAGTDAGTQTDAATDAAKVTVIMPSAIIAFLSKVALSDAEKASILKATTFKDSAACDTSAKEWASNLITTNKAGTPVWSDEVNRFKRLVASASAYGGIAIPSATTNRDIKDAIVRICVFAFTFARHSAVLTDCVMFLRCLGYGSGVSLSEGLNTAGIVRDAIGVKNGDAKSRLAAYANALRSE